MALRPSKLFVIRYLQLFLGVGREGAQQDVGVAAWAKQMLRPSPEER